MAAAVDDAAEAVGNLAVNDDAADYSATESEDEEGGDMPEFVPRARPAGRKCSVMAGVVKVEEGWTPPVFDMSEEYKSMLDARVRGRTAWSGVAWRGAAQRGTSSHGTKRRHTAFPPSSLARADPHPLTAYLTPSR